jgi:hypothetical protein
LAFFPAATVTVVSPKPSTVAWLLVKNTVIRYEIDEVPGFDAVPVAAQPPGADAHEPMVT